MQRGEEQGRRSGQDCVYCVRRNEKEPLKNAAERAVDDHDYNEEEIMIPGMQ
jgi:hypothetical protein